MRSTASSSARRRPAGRRGPGKRRYAVKVHWPYVIAELFFVAYQAAWTVLFLAHGLVLAAVGTTYVGACVAFLVCCYGDHAGKVLFVFNRARIAKPQPAVRIPARSTR